MKAYKIKYTSKLAYDQQDLLYSIFILLNIFSSIILPNQLIISNLSNYLLPIVVASWIINANNFSWKSTPFYIKLFIPLIIFICISPLVHGDFHSMITHGLRYVKLGLVAFLIYQRKDGLVSFLIPGLNIILFLAFIINLISIINPFGFGIDILTQYTNHLQNIETNEVINKNFRLFGSFNSPNTNAIFWSMSFIYLLSIKKIAHHWWINSFLFSIIVFILLTQSRTGLIAFSITLLIYFLAKSLKLKTLVLLISFSTLGLLILKFSGLNYLSQLFRYQFTQIHSIQLRLEAWESYMKIIRESPFLGQGTIERAISLTSYHPDSEYIYVLAVFGLGGLISFLVILAGYFVKGISLIGNKTNNYGAFLIATVILILLNGVTTTVFFNDAISFIFIIFSGVIIFLSNTQNDESPITWRY